MDNQSNGVTGVEIAGKAGTNAESGISHGLETSRDNKLIGVVEVGGLTNSGLGGPVG